VQVGGGIRNLERAKQLLSKGAGRIILGTKSLDEDFLNEVIGFAGADRVVVSIDIADTYLKTEGWQKETKIKATDFIRTLVRRGINWIIYTDISRDGMLCGPNLEEAKNLSQFKGTNFIIAGGISSLEDLKKIKEELPNIWGVVVGRALYEGKIDFKETFSI